MTICSISSPGNIMALGDSDSHLDHDVPGGSTVLRHPRGHRLRPRLLASMWPLVASDINIDPGCGNTMDPDMALGSSLGKVVYHGPR